MDYLTKFLKFLPTAQASMSYSKDPSTQVGAIAIDDDYNIRAQGYNGFPRGVDDCPERLNDRTQKYPRIVHAEANLVAMAARTGASLNGTSVLLTSLHPCSTCAGLLIQAGVKRIFAPYRKNNERWDESSAVALEMLEEAGVEIYEYTEDGGIVYGVDLGEGENTTHVQSFARSIWGISMAELGLTLPAAREAFTKIVGEVDEAWIQACTLTKHRPLFLEYRND